MHRDTGKMYMQGLQRIFSVIIILQLFCLVDDFFSIKSQKILNITLFDMKQEPENCLTL